MDSVHHRFPAGALFETPVDVVVAGNHKDNPWKILHNPRIWVSVGNCHDIKDMSNNAIDF